MNSNEQNFERELKRLMTTAEWNQIARMPEATSSFNLFDLLDDAVCENAWSRIIGFLLDSTATHGLGLAPMKWWSQHALKDRIAELAKVAKHSAHETEWGTFEGRRLDILLKLLNDGGHMIGVIGVENKVWSGEQPRQLSDYQTALMKAFPLVPKGLVFLTPDEREPVTAADLPECPLQRISYGSIVSLCDSILPGSKGTLRLLVQGLRDYIDQNIVTERAMKKSVKQIVSKLYHNEQHRRVIELIVEHRPTVKEMLEEVAESVKRRLKPGGRHDYWPADDDSPPELRVWPEGWEKRAFGICYMLRSKTRKPFIGDSFTILVNAWCESDSSRRRMQKVASSLPPRVGHRWRRWGGWEVLWEGESVTLKDLGANDAGKLSTLTLDAIQRTFKAVTEALSTM